MSFLTAALYGLGAFGQGRQQRQNYQLEQQRQADTHAYEQAQTQAEQARVAIEQQKQAQATEDITRNRGIDPTTGKPFVLPQGLQRVVPHPVGTKYQVTPQDTLTHLYGLMRYYDQTGQKDLATDAATQIAAMQAELLREQTGQQTLNRELTLRSIPQAPTFADTWDINHGFAPGRPPSQPAPLSAMDRWRIQNGYDPRPRPRVGRTVSPDQASQAMSEWYGKWTAATKPGTTALGIPTVPLIPQQQQAAAGKLFSTVDAAPDPEAKAQELAGHVANPTIKKLLLMRGRAAAMKKEAEQSQQQQSGFPSLPQNDPLNDYGEPSPLPE